MTVSSAAADAAADRRQPPAAITPAASSSEGRDRHRERDRQVAGFALTASLIVGALDCMRFATARIVPDLPPPVRHPSPQFPQSSPKLRPYMLTYIYSDISMHVGLHSPLWEPVFVIREPALRGENHVESCRIVVEARVGVREWVCDVEVGLDLLLCVVLVWRLVGSLGFCGLPS